MNQEQIIEIFLNYEDYDRDHLYYIFTDEVAKLSGEGYFLPHHEYLINYKEKFCIFNDFDIDYKTGEKIYTNYKIVLKFKLKTKKKLKKQNVKFIVKIIMNFFFVIHALIKHVKIVVKIFR